MRKITSAFLGLALVGGSCVAKADSIAATFYSVTAPMSGSVLTVDPSSTGIPSQSPITGNGYGVTFSGVKSWQGVVEGTTQGSHVVPVAGMMNGTPEYLTDGFGSAVTTNIANAGSYFSTGTGTITFTFSTPQTSLAILWGSIDYQNSLSFNDASHLKVTGNEVQDVASGFVSNGFQGIGGSAYVVIDTSTPFTTVTATSSVNSFEFGGIAASNTPFTINTPEPDALLLSGFGMSLLAGFALWRRRASKAIQSI